MKQAKNARHDPDKFWCPNCGSPDLLVSYTYRGSGVARIKAVDESGIPYDFDDYDNAQEDDWEVSHVICRDCEYEETADKAITIEVDGVKDKPNFKY